MCGCWDSFRGRIQIVDGCWASRKWKRGSGTEGILTFSDTYSAGCSIRCPCCSHLKIFQLPLLPPNQCRWWGAEPPDRSIYHLSLTNIPILLLRNSVLGIYPATVFQKVCRDLCTKIFTATLFCKSKRLKTTQMSTNIRLFNKWR